MRRSLVPSGQHTLTDEDLPPEAGLAVVLAECSCSRPDAGRNGTGTVQDYRSISTQPAATGAAQCISLSGVNQKRPAQRRPLQLFTRLYAGQDYVAQRP
jgi:hypothetical protein